MRGFIVGDRVISRAFSTHPDWNAGFGRLNGFSFVGASAVGKLHLRENRGREDAFLIRSKGEWLLFLLSDGVGSAALGAWGASLAVNFFAEEFLRDLPAGKVGASSPQEKESRRRTPGAKLTLPLAEEGVGMLSFYRKTDSSGEPPSLSFEEQVERLFAALEKTHAFLVGSAQKEGQEARALSATLLGVLFDTVSKTGLSFQIGDGLILGVHQDRSAVLLEAGDFEVGETAVLTQANWREWCRWRFFEWEKEALQAVFLMSDGVADDCLYAPPQDIVHRFGRDLWREIRKAPDEETAARRLLSWLSEYQAPSSFDDRTLLGLYR